MLLIRVNIMTIEKLEEVQKRMKEHMTYIMLLGKGDDEATMYIRDVINLLGDIHHDLEELKK
jgi:hypothetical protein